MDFADNLRERLWSRIGENRPYANRKRMADALGIDPSQLNRFLDGERGLSVDSLGRVLDGLGARLVLPGEEEACGVRGVRFPAPSEAAADKAPPCAADYLAVPLASAAAVCGPGRIPEAERRGWMLVLRQHESVRFRSDLAAVTIGPAEAAMAPVLHPGDIVLVDRAERSPEPAGGLMLTRGPDGFCAVRRVASRPVGGDVELVFYSENTREYPPAVHLLNRDYAGRLASAIGGRVVWAWSDMTRR